ncbi:hypothetical protein TNCV_4555441 [Trichonephila clavipes]|nr:hypothetical protein TNCV_4555441 [Trichonephila clavipes]
MIESFIALSDDLTSTKVLSGGIMGTAAWYFLVPCESVLNLSVASGLRDLGGQFTGPKREIGGHQTCLSINRLWHELCDMLRRLVGTTAPGHQDCSIQE